MPYRKTKPMPNEKTQRNELILSYYREHPEATLETIARIFNITRGRVFQIIKRETNREHKQSI